MKSKNYEAHHNVIFSVLLLLLLPIIQIVFSAFCFWTFLFSMLLGNKVEKPQNSYDFRHTKVCCYIHIKPVIHRGARLEKGRHFFWLQNHWRECNTSVPATHQAQPSLLHGGFDEWYAVIRWRVDGWASEWRSGWVSKWLGEWMWVSCKVNELMSDMWCRWVSLWVGTWGWWMSEWVIVWVII